jgi:hypothetical protein
MKEVSQPVAICILGKDYWLKLTDMSKLSYGYFG